MATFIDALNKAFDNRVRLGIMSLLLLHSSVDFNTLKKHLALSDGNLSSHMAALERERYISVKKKFIKSKPNTSYSVTALGRKAFKAHIAALEKIINNNIK